MTTLRFIGLSTLSTFGLGYYYTTELQHRLNQSGEIHVCTYYRKSIINQTDVEKVAALKLI